MEKTKIKSKKRSKSMIFKIVLIAVGVLLFLWYLAPLAINGIFNIGNALGFVLSLALVLCGVFLDKIIVLLGKGQGVPGVIFKSFFALACVVLIIVIAAFFSMIAAMHNSPGKDETVVVLGCSVIGEKPSRMLRQRIEAAAEYLKENENSSAVLCGGQGSDEIMTEAECMRRELVKRGIDESRLYLEGKSTDTQENISFCADIIKENGLNTDVTVVTSDFHEKRGAMLCQKYGLNPSATPAKTDFYLAATYWLRDLLGVVREFIF